MPDRHGARRNLPVMRRGPAIGPVMLLAIAISGCGGAPLLAPSPPKSRTVELKVVAANNLNPNSGGRPSPVVLHLYVLKDSGAFTAGKFDPLTRDAAAVLGDALLVQEQTIVRPGEMVTVPLKVDSAAGFIGAVAEYSDVLGAQWRAVMAAPEKKLLDFLSRKPVQVELEQKSVRITATP